VDEIRFPFLRQLTAGAGFPLAAQKNVAIPPAFTCWSRGRNVISGGSVKENTKLVVSLIKKGFVILKDKNSVAHVF